ncbi:MAG: hypothetical protein ACRELE_00880 [Gemmatimonadales bacterium]
MCIANRPKCEECVLSDICPSAVTAGPATRRSNR